MQHKLIDDLRVRLLQLVSGFESVWNDTYIASMNAACFVVDSLKEWNSSPFYLQIQALRRYETSPHQQVMTDGEVGGSGYFDAQISGLVMGEEIFASFIELYNRMVGDMLDTIVNDVLLPELRLTLQPYSELKWFSKDGFGGGKMTTWDDLSVTPDFCPFVLRMQERLSYARTQMCPSLLSRFGILFCAKLAYQYKSFIMQLSFSKPAAEQFAFDFRHGVLSVLNILAQSASMPLPPSSYFKELNEIFTILTTEAGSLMLLKEALEMEKENTKEILLEFGCYFLDVNAVRDVILLRVDC